MRAGTPWFVRWGLAAIAWAGSAATALVFVHLGALVDGAEASPGRLWLVCGLVAIAAGAAATTSIVTTRVTGRAERSMRRAVVQSVFDRGPAGTSGRTGTLQALATDAVDRTANYRAAFIGPMIAALTAPLLVLVVMAVWVDAPIAGWLALLIVLVPLIIGGFQRLVRPVGAQYRRAQGQLTAAFLDGVRALDTLVYARAADRIADDLAHRGESYRRRLMRLLAGNQLLIFVVDAAFSLTVVVAATALAVTRVGDGSLTVGQAIAIVLMTTLVIGPVDVVGQFFYIGISGRASQRQVSAQTSNDPTHRRAASAASAAGATATPRGGQGSLVIADVTAGWGEGPDVLRGLSFRVEPGERVALVGPSGVGKSTVAALIQAHLTPRAGKVIVSGLDTTTSPPDAIRSSLSVVAQRTFLFVGSIAENLRIAAPEATDEMLWHALDQAGLAAEVRAMPHGLATHVGERGAQLSGGQAQRVAIARAWLRDAPILILDEPTSQVDLAGEAAVLDALGRLAHGRTVLMIAHRPGAILAAERVITLTPPRSHAGNGA